MIVGQEDIVEGVLMCLLGGGHALLEGVPGLGKTMLVRTLAETIHANFSRIQFTPDLMPADIVGTNVIVEEHGGKRFEFQKGPIFANIVLADEINRATPKTQSALLEAMSEGSVTVAKQTYKLEKPFFVLATQNPLEMEGTYPLPEAQLDRFFFKLVVEYPDKDALHTILDRTTADDVPQPQRGDRRRRGSWRCASSSARSRSPARSRTTRCASCSRRTPRTPRRPRCPSSSCATARRRAASRR